MREIHFELLPPPNSLKNELECFRISSYAGQEEIEIRICPSGSPGIVFQSYNGKPVIKSITTPSGKHVHLPTLFLYGQVTELSIMHFQAPFTTIQVIFKPHGLRTLFGIDSSTLTNQSKGPQGFGAEELTIQLLAASTDQERVGMIGNFLIAKNREVGTEDVLIEKALAFINHDIAAITLENVRQEVHLSERQFERRFKQVVGITPQFYIRVRRINEAMQLIDSGQYERLVDVAYSLNFHDQSHFIRDIKEFFGITPKDILQKADDFRHDQLGSYMYM